MATSSWEATTVPTKILPKLPEPIFFPNKNLLPPIRSGGGAAVGGGTDNAASLMSFRQERC
jgi:hypothetical protein